MTRPHARSTTVTASGYGRILGPGRQPGLLRRDEVPSDDVLVVDFFVTISPSGRNSCSPPTVSPAVAGLVPVGKCTETSALHCSFVVGREHLPAECIRGCGFVGASGRAQGDSHLRQRVSAQMSSTVMMSVDPSGSSIKRAA